MGITQVGLMNDRLAVVVRSPCVCMSVCSPDVTIVLMDVEYRPELGREGQGMTF